MDEEIITGQVGDVAGEKLRQDEGKMGQDLRGGLSAAQKEGDTNASGACSVKDLVMGSLKHRYASWTAAVRQLLGLCLVSRGRTSLGGQSLPPITTHPLLYGGSRWRPPC